MLPTQHQLLDETGRIDSLRAAAGKNPAVYGRPVLERFVRSDGYYKSEIQTMAMALRQ
jgi:hypothetical protein